MPDRYQCHTMSELGFTIGLAVGFVAFIALAYIAYWTGQAWIGVLGFPLILLGMLLARRFSTYELRADGLHVHDQPAQKWAILSSPRERLVPFSQIASAHLIQGTGRQMNKLILRTADGAQLPVVEERLAGKGAEWLAFVRAYAARTGLGLGPFA